MVAAYGTDSSDISDGSDGYVLVWNQFLKERPEFTFRSMVRSFRFGLETSQTYSKWEISYSPLSLLYHSPNFIQIWLSVGHTWVRYYYGIPVRSRILFSTLLSLWWRTIALFIASRSSVARRHIILSVCPWMVWCVHGLWNVWRSQWKDWNWHDPTMAKLTKSHLCLWRFRLIMLLTSLSVQKRGQFIMYIDSIANMRKPECPWWTPIVAMKGPSLPCNFAIQPTLPNYKTFSCHVEPISQFVYGGPK